jgi:hypothetical protein
MKPVNIIICFLVLIVLILLFARSCGNDIPAVHKIDYQKTIDSLKNINERYTVSLKHYQKENDSLTKQLAETEVRLQNQKAKLTPLRKSVHTIIHSNWDTVSIPAKLEKCDSLKDLVIEYEAQLCITDSLTDEKIASLNQIIQVKDEQLIECAHSFDALKETLQTSIEGSKTCADDLKKLDKKIKRKRFFNRVLGTTVAVVSAAGAIFLTIGLK